MIIGIDHVQLAMPEGEEAAAQQFYEGVLGLRRVPKPPELQGRGGCWFEASDVSIHLGVEDWFRPARKAHPALVVDSLAEMIERLQAGGLPVRTDVALAGYERIHTEDPFGNRIELMQRVVR